MNSELRDFLQQQLNDPIQSVTPLAGGEVNQTYLLTTATGRVVARLNDLSELPRFEKESGAWSERRKLT